MKICLRTLGLVGLGGVAMAVAAMACSATVVNSPAPAASEDSGTTPAVDAGPTEDSAPAAPFELKSSVLEEGATFAVDNTCTGKNVSPDLTWGPGPEGTLSYAIVFNDESLDFLHGVTYDIPASVTSLPASVKNEYTPAALEGAKQTLSYLKNRYGYAGPCAPKPNTDVYEFVLYALDVETLPGMTQTMTKEDAEAVVKEHSLGSTKLKGKYKQP